MEYNWELKMTIYTQNLWQISQHYNNLFSVNGARKIESYMQSVQKHKILYMKHHTYNKVD